MKKKYIVLIIIAIIIVAIIILAFLFITNIVNPLDKSCNSGSDCVLAYTGLGPCEPCDGSSSEMQCVSLKEVEDLQNRRNLIGSRAQECMTCLTPKILYRCICGQNGCEKTTSCSVDSDCKTQGYACLDKSCVMISLESVKNNACQELISKGCNVSTDSIKVYWDADINNIVGDSGDTLEALCQNSYSMNDSECKTKLCGCT